MLRLRQVSLEVRKANVSTPFTIYASVECGLPRREEFGQSPLAGVLS